MQVSLVVMLLIAFLWAETSPDVGRRERDRECGWTLKQNSAAQRHKQLC